MRVEAFQADISREISGLEIVPGNPKKHNTLLDERNKMKRARVISAIAILLAVLYLFAGIWGLLVLQPPFIDLILGLLLTSIILTTLGIASLSFGLGLWFNKTWAKRGWLLFAILLVVFHTSWAIQNIPFGVGWENYLEIGLFVGIAVVSWILLGNITEVQATEEQK
ncbi:MAG: hypothetical protein Q7J98_14355 [Kiritimatiellia bacterium]|nr:hypothetical protein [Kiritimatiellia bacterium]